MRNMCLLLMFCAMVGLVGCAKSSPEVVVYCAQDQVYAEPLFKKFETASGLRVRALYDSEAVKTVGLANRLLAEKQHPRADLYWGNEEFRARQLEREGVFSSVGYFGQRTRQVVVSTNVPGGPPIQSLLELTNAEWKGKLAMAYPMFGTTATHLHALRQHWGNPLWEAWCRGLLSNEILMLDGNSQVVKAVAGGRARLGLTDSDDVRAGQRENYPVAAWPPTKETLILPNVLGMVKGGPNASGAKQLADFLRAEADYLVKTGALDEDLQPAGLEADWEPMLNQLAETQGRLEELFLR